MARTSKVDFSCLLLTCSCSFSLDMVQRKAVRQMLHCGTVHTMSKKPISKEPHEVCCGTICRCAYNVGCRSSILLQLAGAALLCLGCLFLSL